MPRTAPKKMSDLQNEGIVKREGLYETTHTQLVGETIVIERIRDHVTRYGKAYLAEFYYPKLDDENADFRIALIGAEVLMDKLDQCRQLGQFPVEVTVKKEGNYYDFA